MQKDKRRPLPIPGTNKTQPRDPELNNPPQDPALLDPDRLYWRNRNLELFGDMFGNADRSSPFDRLLYERIVNHPEHFPALKEEALKETLGDDTLARELLLRELRGNWKPEGVK